MPKVFVSAKKDIGERALIDIVRALPVAVAKHLSVEGRIITEDEVDVEGKQLNKFSIANNDVNIIILANYYPERNSELDEKAKLITEEIRNKPQMISKKTSISTWISLSYGGYYQTPQ